MLGPRISAKGSNASPIKSQISPVKMQEGVKKPKESFLSVGKCYKIGDMRPSASFISPGMRKPSLFERYGPNQILKI